MALSVQTSEAIHKGIVRIIVHLQKDELSTGTGVWISPTDIATCAHVLLGCDDLTAALRMYAQDKKPKKINDALSQLIKKSIHSLKISDVQGKDIAIDAISVVAEYDIAILHAAKRHPHSYHFPCSKQSPALLDNIICCGFPDTYGIRSVHSPLTVLRGSIRSLPLLRFTGTKRYRHFSIDALCPPGMSGGPVFDPLNFHLLGLINGYNSWGNESVVMESKKNGKTVRMPEPLYTPLSITFVTPVDKIRDYRHIASIIRFDK